MGKIKDPKRIKAYEFGRKAEDKIADAYIVKGYTVLERNWLMGKTEIDLILQKGSTVVIVEVKARKESEEDAMNAVTSDKRKRMIKAADSYIRQLPGKLDYRFDIATVTGEEDDMIIEIFEDAFVSADIF